MSDILPTGDALSFDFDLAAPPEKVWRALTIPELVERWLSPAPAGAAASTSAEIVESEPPRRISWCWRETGEADGLVTFTLTPSDTGGTLLHLVHARRIAPAMPPANTNAVMMMRAA